MGIPAKVFDYTKVIANKKLDPKLDYDMADYVPTLVNRSLAQSKSTILYAQDLNMLSGLSHEMQWEYAISAVPRGYRGGGKWGSKVKTTDDQKAVSLYYQVRPEHAADMLLVLSEDKMERIRISVEDMM